jgi:pyruvate-formate lyase-activating enzyme
LIVKQIVYEDFVNYRKPSMLVAFPKCGWKCGDDLCQNREIAALPDIKIDPETIVKRYIKNPFTSALVCGGLEPFDSPEDLTALIRAFRKKTDDPCVVFTGYTEAELPGCYGLGAYKNIIVKFGRFIPYHIPHYDYVLGVYLPSDNQYAKQIS